MNAAVPGFLTSGDPRRAGRRAPFWVYAIAVALALLTLWMRLRLGTRLDGPTFILFTVPIIFSAYLGGLGPGLLATVTSVVSASYYLLPPIYSFAVASPTHRWQQVILLLEGVLISTICEALYRARRRAEAALAMSEHGQIASARLASIVDSSDDAIIGKDLDGVVMSWNAAAERIFGYAASEIVGQSITLLIPADRLPEEVDILGRIGRGENVRHFETVRRRKDGRTINVSITTSPMRNSDGMIVGASKIARDITERKRAEEALRASEDQFRTLANSMPQLAWVAQADGSISWYNQRWYDYTGTTPEQMAGWGWQSVHDPKALPDVLTRWREAIASGQPFEMAFPLRGADGEFRTFLTRVQPLKDSHGKVVQWFGTNTDVDELKRMEESLRDTQARLKSTLAAGSVGTWSWDIRHDRLVADEFTARMFSIQTERAAGGLPVSDYLLALHEEDRAGVGDALNRAIQSCSHYEVEYRVRQTNGEYRWLQAKGRVEGDAAGHALTFHGAVVDITAYKEAEGKIRRLNDELELRVVERTAQLEAANAELRESRAELTSLFECLPGLYLVLTPDLKIVAASDAYLKATLTTRDGILGRGLFEIFPDNPGDPGTTAVANMRASLARVMANAAPDTMAIQRHDVRRADGVFEERYWSPINSPAFGSNRQVKYLVHRVEEVTDFVRHKGRPTESADALRDRMEKMEAEIYQSSQKVKAANLQLEAANRELEAFSYSVSHDLRAPLRTMDGFSLAVLEDFGSQLPAEGRRFLLTIREGAQRMGALIDDLLSFARLSRQPLSKQEVDTGLLVHQVLEDLGAERSGRSIDLRIEALAPCRGDPALLRQVWMNLLSNAVKYTRKREPAVIEIGSRREKGVNLYFVRDNGTGFDMQYASKLFGVFQRLHRVEDYEGTGVGLAIVQRIVHRHGGRVWAEGVPDQGATFYFTLEGEIEP